MRNLSKAGQKSATATDQRPSILFVGHTARLSGGEIALSRLLPALGNDLRVTVLLAESGPLEGVLRDIGIDVMIVPLKDSLRAIPKGSIKGPLNLLQSLHGIIGYALKLRRIILAGHFDIVHTNTLKAGFYGCLAARLAGAKSVWHVRDRIASDYLPQFAVAITRVALAILPNRIICNSAATLATISPRKRSILRSKAIVSASPIPEVLDLGDRPRARVANLGSGIRICMVGRFAPWKGQDVLVKAFALAQLPDGSEVVFIGAPLFGEQEYLAQVRDEAQRLGVGGNVRFVGHRDDVDQLLPTFDIMVHASVTPEPFGQVIVEGLAAAVPVIATAGGGPSEIITHGIDGLLYPPGDFNALAAYLTLLAARPGLREKLADAGLHRAQYFSGARVAPRIVELYLDLLGRD